eukprot:6331369-Pyramimonas_sp.AAC.2
MTTSGEVQEKGGSPKDGDPSLVSQLLVTPPGGVSARQTPHTQWTWGLLDFGELEVQDDIAAVPGFLPTYSFEQLT